MASYTLRWSEDRSMYFVEPERGRNVRGFWLFAEKSEYPIAPELIKNPYSGAFAYKDYFRRWFSMRGFIVHQGDPQTNVLESSELVRDYLDVPPIRMVTPASLVFVNRNAEEAGVDDPDLPEEQFVTRDNLAVMVPQETFQPSETTDGSSETGAPTTQEAPSAPDQDAATSEPAPDTALPVATGARRRHGKR